MWAACGEVERGDLIALAASLAVFAVCAVVVADGRPGRAERVVFHAATGLPGWLCRHRPSPLKRLRTG
jgi:hypothetical protein